MNQSELIAQVAAAAEVSKTDAEHILKTASEVVQQALAGGDDVVLPGLGKFSVNERAARTGRNPATGEEIKIAAKRVPKFSAAKALKDAVAAPAKKGKK